VSAPEPPDQLADRRRALQVELDALTGLGGDPLDHPDQLNRVFAGADRCLEVVNEAEAGIARRLRWVAFGLLVVAAVLAILVAFDVFPAVVLLGALLVLAAAVGLLFAIHKAPAARS
jgi:hypothetical protein